MDFKLTGMLYERGYSWCASEAAEYLCDEFTGSAGVFGVLCEPACELSSESGYSYPVLPERADWTDVGSGCIFSVELSMYD